MARTNPFPPRHTHTRALGYLKFYPFGGDVHVCSCHVVHAHRGLSIYIDRYRYRENMCAYGMWDMWYGCVECRLASDPSPSQPLPSLPPLLLQTTIVTTTTLGRITAATSSAVISCMLSAKCLRAECKVLRATVQGCSWGWVLIAEC